MRCRCWFWITPHLSVRSEEYTSELQSPCNLVCRLLLEKKFTAQSYEARIVSGVDGMITVNPWRCENNDCRLCECCAPCPQLRPITSRTSIFFFYRPRHTYLYSPSPLTSLLK